MKHSEKYFNRYMRPYVDGSIHTLEEDIKRYGEYREVEAMCNCDPNPAIVELLMLMAKEDNI